jgi:hypothetical protein
MSRTHHHGILTNSQAHLTAYNELILGGFS